MASNLEKGTLNVSTAAAIVIGAISCACSIAGSYYGTIMANQKLRSDFEIQVERQRGTDKIQDLMIAQNASGIAAINSYIGTGMRPEEPTFKKYRK